MTDANGFFRPAGLPADLPDYALPPDTSRPGSIQEDLAGVRLPSTNFTSSGDANVDVENDDFVKPQRAESIASSSALTLWCDDDNASSSSSFHHHDYTPSISSSEYPYTPSTQSEYPYTPSAPGSEYQYNISPTPSRFTPSPPPPPPPARPSTYVPPVPSIYETRYSCSEKVDIEGNYAIAAPRRRRKIAFAVAAAFLVGVLAGGVGGFVLREEWGMDGAQGPRWGPL